MINWSELTQEMERLVRLRNFPVAYKRVEDPGLLSKIPGMRRINRSATFCQLSALARTRGWSIGVTSEDNVWLRCSRIVGLTDATAETMKEEATVLGRTWFSSKEEALKQEAESPRIPKGKGLLLAPLALGKFDPDVVLIYETPAKLMMILCGLQKISYERFQFHFIGEGACADSVAQCYVTGKPSLAIPCFGERRFGEVRDEELVLAITAPLFERAVEGMRRLSATGLRFPIPLYGAEHDPMPVLAPKKEK